MRRKVGKGTGIGTGVILDEDLYEIIKNLPKKFTTTYLVNKGLRHYLEYVATHPEYKEPDIPQKDWEIFVNIVKNVKEHIRKPHQPAP